MEELKPKKPRKSRAKPGAQRGGSDPHHGSVACTRRITIALTAEEWAAVVELAGVGRVPPSVWARNAVVRATSLPGHARQYEAHLDAVGGLPSATD